MYCAPSNLKIWLRACWIHCIEYIFFTIQNFEQLALALKKSLPWIFQAGELPPPRHVRLGPALSRCNRCSCIGPRAMVFG